MSLTPEQLARLPKYARDRITYLERDLETALKKLQEGPEVANSFLNPYSDSYRKPLGQNVSIQFGLDDGVHFMVKHEAERNRLDIIGYGNHSDRLVVAPRGGNCVHVALAPLEY